MLTWLIFALPPTFKKLYSTSRNIIHKLNKDGFKGRSLSKRFRLLGSSLAHFGILLLLIGHVFTTTLVDRTDPSHLVTLVKDQPIEHRGYDFIFTDVEKINSSDSEYPFSIGDGYIGIIIDVMKDGEKITQISPGMLRFTTGNSVSPRSEVDRFSTIYGDTIVILDFYQSQELLEWMTFGQSEEVDRVRITVHSLPGSHLVWSGWVIIMLGSLFSLSSGDIRSSKEEE
jgi:cytochrome c biogenesis factor|tara:strand:- start:2 stop:685 length:684 start_codon:yes stop_codon:yes gene_type:complete